jgi:hypothetical protein
MSSRAERFTMVRVLRNGERDDGLFDLEFWQRVGPEGILDAAWDMIADYRTFKGLEGDEPRLQRHVLRIERR